jgi:class 3 adenylate cyclase
LRIADQLGDPHLYAKSLGNIGIVYEEEGDYSNALDYYTQSLHLNEQLGDQKGAAHQLNNLGELSEKQGDYPRALDYCQSSFALASSIGVLDEQKDACECLYRIYKALGNSTNALFYLEKMHEVEDSLHSEETAKKLQQMEFRQVMLQDSIARAEEARLVQEAHQAEVSRQNRTRNFLAAGGFLALLLAGGFFSRWRYVKKSKAIIEKEKNRSENLLLNILPEKIAQELKEKGKADARDFEMVSILFTDFKSFTEQSARLSAAELVAEINHCFKAFDEIIEKYKVEKIKTIGDAYMAAGGLPVPYDDSVTNTVLAALEMQAFVASRKAENDAADKPAFQMRVGIHTGPVVAGIVGIKKFQYDIWGDTVNTANRMESSGEAGKVNISQDTYQLIKGDPRFIFDSRGKVDVKGKGEMEMYFVSRNLVVS